MRVFAPLAPFMLILATAATSGQSVPDRQPPDSPATEPPPLADADLASLRPGSSPLLREGSMLVDARGSLRHDEHTRSWVYHLEPEDDEAEPVALTVLPGAMLHEMINLVEIAEGDPVTFELTGRVLVYRGRGYVLPSHAPQITALEPAVAPGEDAAVEKDAPEGDDSVEQIMRDLQAAVGPVARASGRSAARSSPDADARILAEGTMLVARRGRLTRTANGAWMLVFDADASGLSDPPMTVLPCLLLERMEDHARTQGGEAPMLISGRVLAFNGRNYLLPSVFQIPRGRSRLTP